MPLAHAWVITLTAAKLGDPEDDGALRRPGCIQAGVHPVPGEVAARLLLLHPSVADALVLQPRDQTVKEGFRTVPRGARKVHILVASGNLGSVGAGSSTEVA